MRVLRLSALWLILNCPLAAQGVRGRVTGPDGGAIPGAIVLLVDAHDSVVARALSSAIGSYSLRAPTVGSYRVRVLRIGYPAFTGPATDLAAGYPAELSLQIPDDPILLADLSVTDDKHACRADEQVAGATATLLEEVRKAVGAADLALHDRDLRFEVVLRALRSGLHVERAEDSLAQVIRSWPVHSLPARLLADKGFVQPADSVSAEFVPDGSVGLVWFGPDPTTLFADAFLGTHCYRVVQDRRDADRVGLKFLPVPGRHLPDIQGTLWLRRRTLGLERIEYEYVNLPRHLTRNVGDRPVGTMDLLRLPSGLWIVSKWSLKVPIERTYNNGPIGVAGWLEQGGEIRHIRSAQGEQLF